jgi:DNA-binding response OmpR family regulator
MRILLLSGKRKTASFLKEAFESEYNVVNVVNNVERIIQLANEKKYDVIIIDTEGIPDSPQQLCGTIKTINKHQKIIVISHHNDPKNKALLLNSGADDLITRPFSFEELSARVRAICRRNHHETKKILEVGGVVLDCSNHVTTLNEKVVDLTRKEFSILKLLIQKRGSPLSRTVIVQSVWGIDSEINSKIVDLHIHKLRKKLHSENDKFIITVPGRGYLIP